MSTWRRRAKGQRGAAAVEFAVVLPLLVTLLFGIIEMGFVMNRWITVTHAAREGVRRLAVGDPVATAEAKARDAAVGLAPAPSCVGVTATPTATGVQMTCTAVYNLQLFIYSNDVTLRSVARASKE
jgi:Flp pilus assembly protein TadG